MFFFLFTGHIIISILIFIIFFGKISSIKDSGKNVYLEMPWNKIFVISIVGGLVISPIWICIFLFLSGLDDSGETWGFTVITGSIMIIYIIIIVICAVGMDKKNRIIRRNNKN
jgi:hypothetical protein